MRGSVRAALLCVTRSQRLGGGAARLLLAAAGQARVLPAARALPVRWFSVAAAPVLQPLPSEVLASLRGIVGEDGVKEGLAVREQHGRDESYHSWVDGCFPPQAVLFPRSTEEVSAIVKLCAAHRIPVVPSAACTSLEGHTAALRGGVGVNLMLMDEILEVNQQDLDCKVQAGVKRLQLNKYLHDTGLFFTVDPGADASIGGMASTRASGTNTIKYGNMRTNVLGLTAVLPNGEIVRTGGRARKSSSGYDLTALLVGAEGTLGIITELELRLFGQPEAVSAAVCEFDTLEAAVDATITIIQFGIPVARIELVDEAACDAVNKSFNTSFTLCPQLFFEFHGSDSSVKEQAERVGEIVAEYGGKEFKWASSQEERTKLWTARHNAYYASLALRPGCKGMVTDACVPISALAECIAQTDRDKKETGLLGTLVGHVGDGNFHIILLLDPEDQEELLKAKGFCSRLAQRAITLGGTCTGEHGIGYGKLEFLELEHGKASLEAMRAVKRAMDPHNLMNPGKLGSAD